MTKGLEVMYKFPFFVILVMAAFGGSANEKQQKSDFSVFSPSDMSVVNTHSPAFVFSIGDVFSLGDVLTPQEACNGNTPVASHKTTLTVLETGDATSEEEVFALHKVMFSRQMDIPLGCQYKASFEDLTLKEHVGYAWYFMDEETGERSPLNRIIYAQQHLAGNVNPFECKENHVREGSFLSKNQRGEWQQNTLDAANESAAVLYDEGHDDDMSAMLKDQHFVIYQKLNAPLIQGENYQVNLSLKTLEPGAGFQLNVLAFNDDFSGIDPNAHTAVIGLTGTLPDTHYWLRVPLEVWTAFDHFESIAIAVVPIDDEKPPVVLLDRMCVSRTDQSPCDNTNDDGTTRDIVDFTAPDAQGPIETEFEYLLGAVEALYPDHDTSTINWYHDGIGDTPLGCASVDNEKDSQEELDLLAEYETEDAQFDDDATRIDDAIADVLAQTRDLFAAPFSQITPISNDSKKCSPSDWLARDPEKPFSGRDIVYIHGLQMAALKGNVTLPATFQEKWPTDPSAFYQDGVFHDEATSNYWNLHIKHALGFDPNTPVGRPSNSYLVVTYSANQRLDIGIHAVLSQIKDAMGGVNDGVVQSEVAYQGSRCFGDSGIVVVTHSTGGLVASAMFGLAEKSHSDPAVNNFYGDVRFITEKIDAQVGINAAYGGSDVAEFALGLLSDISLSPLLTTALENHINFINPAGLVNLNIWYNSILVDLVPSNASTKWRPWMESTIPTLTLVSAIAGKTAESGPLGMIQGITKGFDDAVLFPTSQANNVVKRPRFEVTNRKLLKDKSMGKKKRNRIIADTKKASGAGYRNYVMSPTLGVTGMLQHQSVKALVDLPNQNVANHHTVLQTTGDHLDTVNDVFRNGANYGYAKFHDRNNEESSIVFNSALYSQGLLHPDFGGLTREWVRKKTWGFYLPRLWFLNGQWWKPRIIWHYHEQIKWKRHYHLLKDHDSKMGIDYMYDYVLRD
ncbi:hypothetical protein [Enterovibrio norvegicus]|uniref:hypothetical protein n=1 Tax=Enterovibrio norvegicus TaxID=188144 RepID=UPI0024B17A7A|nr:hypothetical protein [Enterovibrio norvegicus]